MNQNNNNQYINNNQNAFRCPNCGNMMQANICRYCNYQIPNSNWQQNNFQQNYQNPQMNMNQNPYMYNNGYYNQQPNYNNHMNRMKPHRKVSKREKIVTLLLCLFLGEFGIHRFYVGKTGTGILYLFTFGLLGIGAVVDFFMILFDNFRDVNNLPLRK